MDRKNKSVMKTALVKAGAMLICLLLIVGAEQVKANGCTGSSFTVQYSPICGCWQICSNAISDCDLLFNVTFDFGDGSAPYSSQTPCHKYTTPGTYTITMTVSGLCHFSSMTCHITHQVTVTQAQINNVGVSANFVADTACHYSSTHFTDLSSYATVWHWDFGNNQTSSQQNPTFTFDSCGAYPVTLIISGTTPCCGQIGRDTITKIVYVNCAPEDASNNLGDTSSYIYESFSQFQVDTACLGDPTHFSIVPHDSITTWSWQFSDGGSAGTVANTSHTFLDCGPFVNNHGTIIATNTRGCTHPYDLPVVVYCPISAVINITHELCGMGNGAVSITASGGSGNYIYSIDSGATFQSSGVFTGLSEGPLNIIVTDADGTCSTYFPGWYLGSIPGPSTSIDNIISPLCYGDSNGAINVSVSGGRGPYTYHWNTGAATQDISGLPADFYSLTVTDHDGCVDVDTFQVTQPDEFIGTMTIVDIKCYGWNTGTAVLAMTGGVPPPRFIWSSGDTTFSASGLAAGTYYVTATDSNGCVFLDTAVINQAPEIIPTLVSSTNSSCGACDGAATVSVTGGIGPLNYSWGPQANNQTTLTATALCAGIYHVDIYEDTIPSCNKSITVTIGNVGAETLNVTPTDILCYGACTGSAVANLAGGCGTPPCIIEWYDSVGNSLGTGGAINSLCAGSYFVQVTNDSNCITFSNYNINQPDSFSAGSVVKDISCAGLCDGSITLTPSGGTPGYTFQWFDSMGLISGQTSNVLNNQCPGNYSAVISDLNSCSDTFYFTINSVSFSATVNVTNNVCFGNCLGTARVTVTGGVAPLTYAWLDALNNPIPGQSASTIDSLCAGVYSVNITDATSCMINLPFFISEPPPLTAATMGTNLPCNGDCLGMALATANGGTPPYHYQWIDSTGVYIRNGQTADIDSLCAGTYDVEVTDSFGCSSGLVPVSLSEPSALTLSGVVTDVTCHGDANGGVDITVSGGSMPYNFTWNGVPGGEDLNGASGGTYGVVVTDNNGCSITDTFTIHEPAVLTDSIFGRNLKCNGASDGFAAVSVKGGTKPYSYAWDDPGSQSDSAATGLPAEIYHVTITDLNGCVIVDSITLTEPNPMSTFINTTPYAGGYDLNCNNGVNDTVVIFAIGGVPPYSYLWSDSSTTDTIANVTAGTWVVTVTDMAGCAVVDSVVLSSQPTAMNITHNYTDPTCTGFSDGTIDITVGGGTPPYFYFWRRDTVLTSNDSVVISNSQDLNGVNFGVYFVTVLDTNGCFANDTIVLTDPPLLPLTYDSVSICGNDSVFLGGGFQTMPGQYYDTVLSFEGCDSVIVTDLSVVPFFFTPNPVTICANETYFAGGGNQNTQGIFYDSLVSRAGCDSIVETDLTVLPLIDSTFRYSMCDGDSFFAAGMYQDSAGTYIDTLQGTTGCDTILHTIISVIPVFPPNGVNDTICPDDLATLDAGPGYLSYLWQPDGQTTQTIMAPVGSYTVSVIDQNNCPSTGQFEVVQAPDLGLYADPEIDTVIYGDYVVVNVISGNSVPINHLIWSPSTGLDCDVCPTVTVQPEDDQTYMVVAYDNAGCPDTAYVEVIIDRSGHIYIPNAFSPNDDGKNDVFKIELKGWKKFRMLVFDRWGEKLFESFDPDFGWDGTFKGEPKNPGVYVYYLDIVFNDGIKPDEYVKHWKGSVTLIR